jgi:hypothetical protein
VRRTLLIALAVGLNFVVPFCVSNLGVLAGTKTADTPRRKGGSGRDPSR